MQYEEMRTMLREHNWDDGFALPRKLLNEPACDLALALEIFYLADGCAYLSGHWRESGLTLWRDFISCLFEEIQNGRYPQTGSSFTVPLNRVTKYKFQKNGVPEVFLTDLPVLNESLRQAIDDTRHHENLHGPFLTAEEAIRSMLEDESLTS